MHLRIAKLAGRTGWLSRFVLPAAMACLGIVVPTAAGRDLPMFARPGDSTKIVEVVVPDAARLNWLMEDLGANSLACIASPGVQRFQVTAEQLERIRGAGLTVNVLIDDAEWEFVVEKRRIERANRMRGASWFIDYKNLAQINARLDEYVATYPGLVTKLPVGTSHEGRTFYALRISGPGSHKPAILLHGCQHAREWISPMTCMYIADQLLTRYGSEQAIRDIVDGLEFYIIPVCNPDGYEYTWTNQRLWRKNRRNNGGGSFGVDLNRNWNIDWNGGGSTSTNPSMDNYVGPAPFSEPESTGLRDFFLARPQIVANIDYHSYGQLILHAYGFTEEPAPRQDAIDSLGDEMDAAIQSVNGVTYTNGHACDILYCASGTASDWMHLRGSHGMAVELRNTSSFELPPSQIIPTGAENFAGLLEMAHFALQQPAVDFIFTSAMPSIVAPLTETTIAFELVSRFAGEIDAQSVQLHWRAAGESAFQSVATEPTGATSYQASILPQLCGSVIEYYFSLNSDAGLITFPAGAPAELENLAVAEIVTAVEDDAETDLGWLPSASGLISGQWSRGVPVNDPNWGYDPAADGDGSGQCWLTQNELGNTDVDNGSVTLTSPVVDMSAGAGEQWEISYDYYLNLTDAGGADRLVLEATASGRAGWIELARHDSSSAQWRSHTIDQAALTASGLAIGPTVQFRFVANDDNPQSIVEAGIDGFTIRRTGCPDTGVPGDLAAPFGTIDVFDLFELLSGWGTGGSGADLAPAFDVVDVFDLFVLLGNWG